MLFKFRKSAAFALTLVLAVTTVLTASAQATTKSLSSNFTLVNLADGPNKGHIQYTKEDGSNWRTAPDPQDDFTMNGLGDQVRRAQYFDDNLPTGFGSVVVSTDGPVGAVVQIQARTGTSSRGAYIGVSQGAPEVSVPLVERHLTTASGIGNSQVIVQNASSTPIDFDILFFDGKTGAAIPAATKNVPSLAANASFQFDLEKDGAALGENWYGSAVVHANTPNGEVAVINNQFNGPNAMQSYNGFTSFATKWGVPLFLSRLKLRGLSSPLVIQNRSGSAIPPQAITLTCNKAAASPGEASFTRKNTTQIADKASFFDFNPVAGAFASGFPDDWYGTCTVDTGAFQTSMYIQQRVVNPAGTTTFTDAGNYRAGAFEGIRLEGTSKHLVVPLIARRLANGFSSNVTIQNLSNSQATVVTLKYKGSPDLAPPAPTAAQCTKTFTKPIPAGGALLQNMRVKDEVANSVPEIPELCFGTLEVTSSATPIDGFVQLDTLDELAPPQAPDQSGDRQMLHNVFLLSN